MKFFSRFVIASIFVSAFSLTVLAAKEGGKMTNMDKVIALLNSIETGDQRAVGYINPTNYIQHNLAVADGLAGFGEVLMALPKNSAKVNVVRSFQDGDFVVTHTDYNFFGPKVGFDIFRFDEGKIVEHWDNLDVKAADLNPSGRTQLDGATEITDLDKTLENKALVSDFVETVLVKGGFDQLTRYVSQDTYLQHNTQVADGLDGLSKTIDAMAQQGIFMVYKQLHAVFGQGNFVLSVSEGTFGGDNVAYYDLFRVSDGKIVEHWDVIEQILPETQWKNDNGKFGFVEKYVVEVATFKLKDDVSAAEFQTLDQAVEDTHVAKQSGFLRRESGLTEDGTWRVIVHWEDIESAEASMASFAKAPAAGAFMQAADTSTMIMRRYSQF